MEKRGAIFEVSAMLVIQGLKAIWALPMEAECTLNLERSLSKDGEPIVLIAAWSPRLPVVPEAGVLERRVALAGRACGEARMDDDERQRRAAVVPDRERFLNETDEQRARHSL